MKKECEYTRKSLHRYSKGHLFKPEQMRIERHLKSCVLCNSEYQALKRIAETRQYLKDITPPEGVAQKMRAGVSRFSVLTRLVYRPLWVIGIAGVAFLVYLHVVTPLLHDPDLEKLDAPAPQLAPAASPASVLAPDPAPAAPAPEAKKTGPAADSAAREADPVVVTITVENEKAAVKRLNEAMKEHAALRTMRFTDSAKEISGSMTAHELLTLFSRVEGVGKIRYKRSRLSSSDSAELIPFVLKLKASPPVAAAKPVDKSVENPVENPVHSPVNTPAASPSSPAAPGQ